MTSPQGTQRTPRAHPKTACLCVLCVLCGELPASAQNDPGKAAYDRSPCLICHGPNGNGDGPGGPLVPITRDLVEFTGIVRQGLGYMAPIPPSEISDAEVERLHGYLTLVSASDLFARVSQRAAPDPDDPSRLSAAIARVEAIASGTKGALVHALLAALRALQVSLSPAAPAELVEAIRSGLDDARAADPDNPHVMFLAGAAAALAPDAAGGLDAAERQLRRALESLPAPAAAGAWPPWNAADATMWLDRVLAMRGDVADTPPPR